MIIPVVWTLDHDTYKNIIFGDFADQAENSRHAGETSQLEEHESALGTLHPMKLSGTQQKMTQAEPYFLAGERLLNHDHL